MFQQPADVVKEMWSHGDFVQMHALLVTQTGCQQGLTSFTCAENPAQTSLV